MNKEDLFKENTPADYIRLVIMLTGYALMFSLAYIVWSFYVPMQEAFNMNNQQIGVMMSVFGTASMIFYFFGGYMADRFNPRVLVTVGYLGTGIIAFYYATFPSFKMLLVIQVLLAIFGVLIFWSAMLKTVRIVSSENTQGRFYSFFEGGWKIVVIGLNAGGIAFFAIGGEGVAGLRTAILYYGVLYIAIGILTWFGLKGIDFAKKIETDAGKSTIKLGDIVKLIKIPEVWMISFLIMALYFNSQTQQYITAFFTKVMGQTPKQAGFIFVITQFGAPILVLLNGFVVDRFGVSRAFAAFVGLLSLALVLLIAVPGRPEYMIMAMGAFVLWYAVLSGARGLYWALMSEVHIPLHLMGTAIGLASIIGYSPDIFGSLLHGWILDAYPGVTGFKYIYTLELGFIIVGFVVALILHKRIKQGKSAAAVESAV